MTAAPALSSKNPRAVAWVSHRPFVALTYLILLTGAGFVVASAVPSVGRLLGWTEVRTVSRSSPHSTSAEQAGLDAMHEKEHSLEIDEDDEPDPAARTARVAIVHAKTQVFEVPGKGALGTLAVGDIVRIIGEREGFVHVLYEDQGDAEIGWVKKSDLMLKPPGEPTPRAGQRRR